MINTKKITSKIYEKIEDKQIELSDELNIIEEQSEEQDYLEGIKNKDIKDIDLLVDYYENLDNNVEKIKFYKFVSFILKDEKKADKLLEELKNLSLLKSTGLLNYAKEQENYSKQILNDFINKLNKSKNVDDNDIILKEEQNVDKKRALLKEYAGFFSPIGIVKEVQDVNEYNDFLDLIKLSPIDKTKSLLMSLNFNKYLHDKNLKNYDILEISSPIIVQEANDYLKENKEEDPYDLFEEYYEIISNNEEVDTEIINKAKNYLSEHEQLIDNLNEIAKQDLNDTLRIYFRDEELREEVYRTTENVERLFTFEIKTILDSYDENDSENIVKLVNHLKPVINYITELESNNEKKK